MHPVLRSAILVSSLAASSFAASFSQLVVFGDSLSDSGNVATATSGVFPGPNYWNNRFTNGPTTTPATNGPVGLWADQLATKLGVADPQPYLAGTGGSNFAFASAETGSNGLFNITDQVNAFSALTGGVASSSALYAIWGGSNNVFNGTGNPVDAADALYANILTLNAEGGKNFLWMNLAPLGSTPRGVLSGQSLLLNAAVDAFNTQWSLDIAKLQAQGINVVGVDVFGVFTEVAATPGAFGFTNLTIPAQGLANVDPNNYLFWDIEHPTTAGHAVVANLAFNDLQAVPEPASILFTLVGMAGLLAAVRVRAPRRGDVHQAGN